MISRRHRHARRPLLRLALAGILFSTTTTTATLLLSGCATDTNEAVTRSGARGFTSADTPVSNSPAGTPRGAAGVGGSIGSNGLGGSRGSF